MPLTSQQSRVPGNGPDAKALSPTVMAAMTRVIMSFKNDNTCTNINQSTAQIDLKHT